MKKQIFAALAAAAIAFPGGAASGSVGALNITDIDIARNRNDITLSMNVNQRGYRLSSNTRWEVTPVIISADSAHSVTLRPFEVAGKNAWYYEQRLGRADKLILLRSGKKKVYDYSDAVPYQDWMEHSNVYFNVERVSCCGDRPVAGPESEPVARLNFTPPEYQATFTYVVPVKEEVKQRTLSGRAYVNFRVNKTDIVPDYMNNTVELRKILNSIDSVRLNKDATVDTIRLTGYASPEGPYKNNVRLAEGRTEAVRDYVKQLYDFPARVYFTNSVPEDWDGLREYVAKSNLADRDAILAFIDEQTPIEDRNDRLRALFPQSYRFLLENEYPWLRHTDYYIHYTIRQYTTVDEILTAMERTPSNLSLNEFFTAAKSFPEGSKEFCDILEKAVLYYPHDVRANLNAANAALSKGAYHRAGIYLDKAGDSGEAEYMRGVLAALEKDYDKALLHFGKAGDSGKVRAAILQVERLRNAEPVEYLQ